MTAGQANRGLKSRIFVLVLAAAVLAGLAYYVKTYVTIDDLVVQEQQVRAAIARHPWRCST